jgi:hypothetical protein
MSSTNTSETTAETTNSTGISNLTNSQQTMLVSGPNGYAVIRLAPEKDLTVAKHRIEELILQLQDLTGDDNDEYTLTITEGWVV